MKVTGSVRREAFEGLEIEHAGSDVETRPVPVSREPPRGGRPAEPARGARAILASNVAPDFSDPLVRTVLGNDTPNECELPHVQQNPRTLTELAAFLGREHCRTHREQRGQLHQLFTGGGVFIPSEETFASCIQAYAAAYVDRDMNAELRVDKEFLGRWLSEFAEVKS